MNKASHDLSNPRKNVTILLILTNKYIDQCRLNFSAILIALSNRAQIIIIRRLMKYPYAIQKDAVYYVFLL